MSTSPETISIIPDYDAMREHMRAIWSDPQQAAFRENVRRDPAHIAFLTRGGADPLPEVADPEEQEQTARNVHSLHMNLREYLDHTLSEAREWGYADDDVAQPIRAWMVERGLAELEPVLPELPKPYVYCEHECPDIDLRCQLVKVDEPHTHMATDGDGRSWAWLGLPGEGAFEVRGPVDAQRQGRRRRRDSNSQGD